MPTRAPAAGADPLTTSFESEVREAQPYTPLVLPNLAGVRRMGVMSRFEKFFVNRASERNAQEFLKMIREGLTVPDGTSMLELGAGARAKADGSESPNARASLQFWLCGLWPDVVR
jgi:hypothetical protein